MRSAMDLLSDSVDFFLAHISIFFYIWLIPTVISLATNFYYPIGDDFFENTSTETMLTTFGFLIVSSLLSMLSYIGYIYKVSHPEETSVSVILSYTLDNAIKFLLTGILMFVVTFIGFLLIFIPGIICIFWFLFVPYVLLLEHKYGTEALSQSKKYVSGRFFKIVGKVMFFSFVCLLYYIVLFIISIFVSGLNENSITVIFSILSFPVTCINVVFCYNLYLDARKEYDESTHNQSSAETIQVPQPQQ